ncbi:helix-turn-helix domain-containing protein [Edaphobacter bradus]|uniref:helix-turn-helix domain-containing protein n=1 Tax=Edaphobacter bradus TaxID=2259016 RepID=UPI0037BFF785
MQQGELMNHPGQMLTQPKMCREPNQRQRREFEPLLTPHEASDYLRVHAKTVIRLARQGQIPALRIGKHWRFRVSDLTEWTDLKLKSACQPAE